MAVQELGRKDRLIFSQALNNTSEDAVGDAMGGSGLLNLGVEGGVEGAVWQQSSKLFGADPKSQQRCPLWRHQPGVGESSILQPFQLGADVSLGAELDSRSAGWTSPSALKAAIPSDSRPQPHVHSGQSDLPIEDAYVSGVSLTYGSLGRGCTSGCLLVFDEDYTYSVMSVPCSSKDIRVALQHPVVYWQ